MVQPSRTLVSWQLRLMVITRKDRKINNKKCLWVSESPIRMLKRQISLRQSFPPDHIILPQMRSDVWHWTGQVYSSTELRKNSSSRGPARAAGALNTQHPAAREGKEGYPSIIHPTWGRNSWWPGIVMTKLSSFILRKTLRSKYWHHPHVTEEQGWVHLSDGNLGTRH